ncbi:TonB-dependent receptor [Aquidulcibacter sp.]|jgi:iron complex outermembrane receptor protein|uniref:TonB-dependent receptor n=1 Tax=Aquidulcibacter sp. TaxID=2052990 RepID=UPI0037BF7B84
MKLLFNTLLTSTALAIVLSSGSANAQSNANNTEASKELEIIVVTAQKRAERLINVPVSIVATSGAELEARNFNSATDLQYVVPGLGLGDSNTPRGAGLRIRGIGTNVFADGIEQSVGTVVDGVPLARAGQGLADIVDIERIEVLRGPQGMLFGRNASAGLINVVTRGPTNELSTRAYLAAGENGLLNLSGAISGPIIINKVSARISGYQNKQDGIVRTTDGRMLNNRDEFGFRSALRLEATPDFEVLVRADYSERDNACCVWTPRALASATTDPRPGILFLSGDLPKVTPGPDNVTIGAASGDYFNKVISRGTSIEANWNIGEFTITSLSALRNWRQKDNNDADLGPLNVLDDNFGANNLEQISQEIRLTSPAGEPFEYVLGAFYYKSKNAGSFDQVGRFALSFARAQAAGISLPLAPGVVLPPSALFGRSVETVIDVRDVAIFGQGSFDITDKLSLIYGARYTDTKVGLDFERVGAANANAFNFVLGGAFAPLVFQTSTKDTNVSWRFGAQYKLNENSNVYLTVAKGYKGPGFNNLLDLVIPASLTADKFTVVRPEIPTSFEAGYKGRLADGRLRIEAAAYQTTFEDFQAQVVERDQVTNLNRFAIRNAGELKTQGAEIQMRLLATDNLTLGASAAWNDTEFTDFTGAACPRLGAVIRSVGVPCGPVVAGGANAISFDASGQAGTNAPELTFTLDGRYEKNLSAGILGFIQANYFWRDAVTFGLYPDNIPNPTIQPSYGIFNVSLGAEFYEGKVVATLFARNLTDENFVTSIFDLPFDGAGGLGQYTTTDARRLIGVSLNIAY